MNETQCRRRPEALRDALRRAVIVGFFIVVLAAGLQARAGTTAWASCATTAALGLGAPLTDADGSDGNVCAACNPPRHGCQYGDCCACCDASADAECTPRCGCFQPSDQDQGSGLLDKFVDLFWSARAKKK